MFRQTLRHLKASPPPPPPPAAVISASLASLTTKKGASAAPMRLTEFRPSPRAQQFAAETGITFPGALRLAPGQNFADFALRLATSPRHVVSYYHLIYLNVSEHPLADKILHGYTERMAAEPLWCYVQSSVADGSKAVVRTAAARMVRAALFRALNAAGYDSCGRGLDGTKGEISGTIRIVVSHPRDILKVEFARLVEYLTGLLVDAAIPRLGRDGSPRPSKLYRNPSPSSNPEG
jgi:hypothetical protein